MFTRDERLFTILIIIGLILIIVTGLIGVIGNACQPPQTNANSQYAKSGIVTRVDRKTDTVTFADPSGNEWSFAGTEDWMVGDYIAAVMDDNGTESILDDIIVSVHYEAKGE